MKSNETESLGWLIDGVADTPVVPAVLRLSGGGSWVEALLGPDHGSYAAEWFNSKSESGPKTLMLAGPNGTVILAGCRYRSWTFGSSGRSGRIEPTALVYGADHVFDYSAVDVLKTTVDGLHRWWGADLIDNSAMFQLADDKVLRVPKETASVELPSVGCRLTMSWSYSFDDRGVHKLSELAAFESGQTGHPRSWDEHRELHQAMQDLLTIAFWKPLPFLETESLVSSDPVVMLSGDEKGPIMRKTKLLSLGRGRDLKASDGSKLGFPMFAFRDIGPVGLETWLTQSRRLGGCYWLLSSTKYESGVTAETSLLQTAVSLEELARFVKQEAPELCGSFASTYVGGLQRIIASLGEGNSRLESAIKELELWPDLFNRTYKGVKHADNKAVDFPILIDMIKTGQELARIWLLDYLAGTSKVKRPVDKQS